MELGAGVELFDEVDMLASPTGAID